MTGASIGIGLAAATAFAEAGANVVLLYARSKHTEKIASDLADRTGVKVKAYQLDGEWLPVIRRRIIDTPCCYKYATMTLLKDWLRMS